ncbi:helix-turn-helix domain-containing protein [bacterium]|nr:helix-turn-helix domain-containing protein [bacterium]
MHSAENIGNQLFVSEEELVRLFGLSRSYWQKSRVRGGGIPFYKIGRSVRYRLSEVEAFFESNRANSTSHADQLNKKGDSINV